MEGLKVRCLSCGLVLYETTKQYNCHKPLSGDMLRLTEPFYSYNWPTYDGSLAVESTSRFLMFCSQCSGYISPTGVLDFVDFLDSRVSKERSEMSWEDSAPSDRKTKVMVSTPLNIDTPNAVIENIRFVVGEPKNDTVTPPTISDIEDSVLKDDTVIDPSLMTPGDVIKKIEKEVTFSRSKRSKKGKRK